MDEKRRKQMNKALVILLVPLVAATAIAIFVIVRFPGLHDNANDIRERLWQVESVDEQLEQLELLAKKYGDALPWTQWDTMHWEGTSIILRPAAELPEDLVPDLEGAEPTDALPEEVRGAKLLALYQHRLPRNRYLLGDFQIRLPKAMRATTLQEADAVLLVVYDEAYRDDYLGAGAKNRYYNIYVCRPGGRCWLLYSETVTPPLSGTGVLAGEPIQPEALWDHVKEIFRG